MVNIKHKPMIILSLWLMAFCSFASNDPTAPFTLERTAPAKPKVTRPVLPELQSIVCQQDCYAVLSDQLLAVGQQFQGYQITRVTPEQVTVRRGNQHWQLSLLSPVSFSLSELNQP